MPSPGDKARDRFRPFLRVYLTAYLWVSVVMMAGLLLVDSAFPQLHVFGAIKTLLNSAAHSLPPLP